MPLKFTEHPFDELYFSVMAHDQPFEAGVIRKIINKDNIKQDRYGNVVITLSHEDTENLLPGNYTYEIKTLTYLNNSYEAQVANQDYLVATIVPKRKFFILA